MIKYLKNQWMWFKIDNAPILGDDKGNAFFIKRVQKANPEWSTVKINLLIEEYKQFMYLAGTSDEDCTPSQDVDKVWHEHILFTKDYYDYCNNIIGKIIHHKPERENDDSKKYEKAFEKTNAKKKAAFKPAPSPKPSVVSPSIVQPADTSLTDMLLMQTILNNNDTPPVSHEPCHDSSPSHASCSSHSESSHSSCSSSSCSSSSCSSSSCGGGGGD